MFSLLVRMFFRRRRPDVAPDYTLRIARGGLKQRWRREADGALHAHWATKNKS